MSGGELRVLTWHRVMDPDDASVHDRATVSATPEGFARQAAHLAARFRVVSADEVLAAARGEGALPPRAVLLTFDDGYRDFGEVAWPVLRRLGLPATLLVPTGFAEPGAAEFWWDRLARAVRGAPRVDVEAGGLGCVAAGSPRERRTLLRRLKAHVKGLHPLDAHWLVDNLCRKLGDGEPRPSQVLPWGELRRLAGEGVHVAAHTRTHAALDRLSPEEARAEIRAARDDLRRELGVESRVLAYPYGSHDDAVVEAARAEGIELGCTCLPGHDRFPGTDPLRLRRTNVSLRVSPMVFRARLTRVGSAVDAWRHGRHDFTRR